MESQIYKKKWAMERGSLLDAGDTKASELFRKWITIEWRRQAHKQAIIALLKMQEEACRMYYSSKEGLLTHQHSPLWNDSEIQSWIVSAWIHVQKLLSLCTLISQFFTFVLKKLGDNKNKNWFKKWEWWLYLSSELQLHCHHFYTISIPQCRNYADSSAHTTKV